MSGYQCAFSFEKWRDRVELLAGRPVAIAEARKLYEADCSVVEAVEKLLTPPG